MTKRIFHIAPQKHDKFVRLDMSDCYTWSFPEFVPFCPRLYYFSNFKDFNTLAQA